MFNQMMMEILNGGIDQTPHRVLITGASGFLGAHLTMAFKRANWHVLSAVSGNRDRWRLRYRTAERDVVLCNIAGSVDYLSEILKSNDVDLVINCVAYGVDYGQQDEDLAMDFNVRGPVNLAQAAAKAGVKAMIHIGTSQEYGSCPEPISETTPLRPVGLYGSTKARGTEALLRVAAVEGLPVAILRPFVLFGPLEAPYKFMSIVVQSLLARRHIKLTAGEQIRDHLYVEDMANACVTLAAEGHLQATGIFNVGTGTGMTLRAFGEIIRETLGAGDYLEWGALPYRAAEIMCAVASTGRLQTLTGWRPQVSVVEGLRRSLFDVLPEQALNSIRHLERST